MTRTEAKAAITRHANELIVVRFVKRTTGEVRRMLAIFNPARVDQSTFKFNPAQKGLLPVWDCEKGGRRFVNLDGVLSVKPMSRTRRMPKPAGDRGPVRRPVEGDPTVRTWGDCREEIEVLFG